MKILELYNNWARNRVNKSENGYASYRMFNDLLKSAETTLLSWLTGSVSKDDKSAPIPYEVQKNKDYIKRFVASTHGINVVNIPENYYYFDALYKFNNNNYKGIKLKDDCDYNDDSDVTRETIACCNVPIPILETAKFYNLCNSNIDEIRPTFKSPIARLNDKHQFETAPCDAGLIKLDYIRYPKFGEIVTKIDPIKNDEIPDEALTQDLEWDDWALPHLLNLLTNEFSIHTRERALAEHNSTAKITT